MENQFKKAKNFKEKISQKKKRKMTSQIKILFKVQEKIVEKFEEKNYLLMINWGTML